MNRCKSIKLICPGGSDAECALVGEQRRHAARVQEDDILVFAPTALADQGDQARKPLARIHRIECKSLEPACKPDRFDRGFMRDPVGRSRMPRDDFHGRFVERNSKQIGRLARKRHNIGSHLAGSASTSIPTIPVFGMEAAAPTTRPACVSALPVQCTMAADAKPKRAACDSISEIVVA